MKYTMIRKIINWKFNKNLIVDLSNQDFKNSSARKYLSLTSHLFHIIISIILFKSELFNEIIFYLEFL